MFLSCVFIQSNLQAAWVFPPTTISDPGSTVPQMAVDPAGNTVAVWQGFDGANQVIQSAVLPLGGSWSSVTNLTVGYDSSAPFVAVDAAGDAVAVWVTTAGGVQAATLPFGGSWSSVVDLTSTGDSARVSMSDTGHAVAVWVNTGTTIIQSSTLIFGGSWSSALDISLGTDSEPSVGIDSGGNAVAAWKHTDGGNNPIQAATLPFGGSWSSITDISGATGSFASPQVAVISSGDAVVVWQGTDGFNTLIQSSTLPIGGSWSSFVNVSPTGENSIQQKIAINAAGYAVAVWTHLGPSFIKASTLSLGGSWSSPVTVSNPIQSTVLPQVGVDGVGNAFAVWREQHGFGQGFIQSSTLPFGGSWTSPINLSNITQTSVTPVVAVNVAGYAVAGWNNFALGQSIQAIVWMPAPVVTSVSPTFGPIAGGTEVTITGAYFVAPFTVKFGSVDALSVILDSIHSIRAIAPPGTLGTVDITVTTDNGTSLVSSNDEYTYVGLPPPPPPPPPPSSIQPPRKFHGELTRKYNLKHNKNFALVATWKAPKPSANVAFYKIYKNNKVLKKYSVHSRRIFKWNVFASHGLGKRYKIRAFTSDHQKSKATKLKIVKVKK